MRAGHPCRLLLTALLGASAAAAQTPIDGPQETDPAAATGALQLLGGDLSDGNYGGGGIRADGALHHVTGDAYVSGDGWWVLSCRGEDCRLDAAALRVEAVDHPTYDGPAVPGQRLSLVPAPGAAAHLRREWEGDGLGARARRTDDVVILAALRVGADAALPLKAGWLTTWWYAAPRAADAGAPPFAHHLLPTAERAIRLDNGEVLHLRQQPRDADGTPALAIEIALGEVRQSLGLHPLHLVDVAAPVELGEVLQWVGDLDGDSRPDLLVNHTGFFWEQVLWLSSHAKPGELVGEAARFTFAPPDSPGC